MNAIFLLWCNKKHASSNVKSCCHCGKQESYYRESDGVKEHSLCVKDYIEIIKKKVGSISPCKNCGHPAAMIRKKFEYPLHILSKKLFNGKTINYPSKLCPQCKCKKPEIGGN
ncbi:MAG: hypothetical protein UX13_C0024G0012 [Candidatus Woesebacteria bacterium GW2011_GWB1_45_5]|uniref:Uncharacterized protein n=1 Tax=Candidatus Woesebacteria bacterium GW2011_GWB1_45_5 TaxID=1618581 RepID=A0A0G1QMV1_9BACT|nr:MAG: hypothetical protein UX13_C0024G0012 [Candidatus Woesebacteria bacterium GW2011_GWB1_45_5]